MRHIYKCNVAKVCCSINQSTNQPTYLSLSLCLYLYLYMCISSFSPYRIVVVKNKKKSQRRKKKSRRLGFANSTHPPKKKHDYKKYTEIYRKFKLLKRSAGRN